jgi:hypothetical protein
MSERKDRIRVHIEGREFSVVGGDFQEMLAAVKQINGRRFVGELKVWQLPGRAAEIKNQLDILGYRLEGGPELDSGQMPLPQSDSLAAGRPAAKPARQQAAGDRIRLSIQGQSCAVVGGGFQEMLAVIKHIPGRRFDSNAKVWDIPGDPAIIKNLIETAGFQLEGADGISNPPPAQETDEFPRFDPNEEIPAYEPPDFSGPVNLPAYEPPDWWNDDAGSPARTAPPNFGDDEAVDEPPLFPGPTLTPTQQLSAPTGDSSGGDQIRLRLGDQPFVVSGGSFQAMLAVIKNLPGRRFNGNDKVWELPANTDLESVQQVIKAAGFVLTPG